MLVLSLAYKAMTILRGENEKGLKFFFTYIHLDLLSLHPLTFKLVLRS